MVNCRRKYAFDFVDEKREYVRKISGVTDKCQLITQTCEMYVKYLVQQ